MDEYQQKNEVTKVQNVWHTVTPLSKYLAMALFILLPFIGGYVGYHNAPEKVLQVERLVEVEADLSRDEQNKIKLREALVGTIENKDRYVYEHVLKEPNGFDPYAHNPKSRDLDISGLALTEKSFGSISSVVTFTDTDRFESSVIVNGEFEYRFSGYDGGMWFIFRPDAETQAKLPWPSTSEEAHDWYLVMYRDNQEITKLLESYCDTVCEEELMNMETNDVIRFAGTASVSSVAYEFENIGAGTISPIIWLYDLEFNLQE